MQLRQAFGTIKYKIQKSHLRRVFKVGRDRGPCRRPPRCELRKLKSAYALQLRQAFGTIKYKIQKPHLRRVFKVGRDRGPCRRPPRCELRKLKSAYALQLRQAFGTIKYKIQKPHLRRVFKVGRDRDRTDDLLVANEALSQLSYTPVKRLFTAADLFIIAYLN